TTTEPTRFHSPASFVVNGCRVEINKSSGKSWTTAFADAMIALAKTDPRVFALTAAMAAGMAKSGLRPFAAIYSTFTQRCFDQIWQEVVLNGQPVVFAMDRAG